MNNKNTVRSFVKIAAKRKKRKNGFNDEDFEGDFLEVQENNQGIANAASAVCNYQNVWLNLFVYNKLFQKSFN
jgi:hypothetical protein